MATRHLTCRFELGRSESPGRPEDTAGEEAR